MSKAGDHGLDVVEVQRLLTANGFWCEQDGDFGPATEAALLRFQRLHGLPATGEADADTLRALRAVSGEMRAVKG